MYFIIVRCLQQPYLTNTMMWKIDGYSEGRLPCLIGAEIVAAETRQVMVLQYVLSAAEYVMK